MSIRATIVVTGSELVRGDRQDRNGPFLAASLLAHGIEPAEIRIVGDAPVELERAFADGLTAELLVVSGGLGPTHDDRTVELLARAAGRELRFDEALSHEIAERSRVQYKPGIRKQATYPEGAVVVGLAGTAPALVLDTGTCVAVVLPGPPRELQKLWLRALETKPFRRVLARVVVPDRRVLRFYGCGESAVAEALARAGGESEGIEVTICAHDFETHMDLFVQPGAEARAEELERQVVASLDNYLYARTESPVEELVLELCRARDLTLVTAESCTGGLVAARLTSVPGSSDVVLGGIVSYANEVKVRELGVGEELLREHGAVSAEVAAAMARGARERLGADVAVAVTGVAGPGGGTPEKPVGLVYVHASGPNGGEQAARLDFPGDRETIRSRATVAALHLVHTLVSKV
ncbi:MAG TPA: nicotinamide-nucleotide amidohydrolase family protein [Gaiellaceae bacterium]